VPAPSRTGLYRPDSFLCPLTWVSDTRRFEIINYLCDADGKSPLAMEMSPFMAKPPITIMGPRPQTSSCIPIRYTDLREVFARIDIVRVMERGRRFAAMRWMVLDCSKTKTFGSETPGAKSLPAPTDLIRAGSRSLWSSQGCRVSAEVEMLRESRVTC
jgi:hypothetical protein